MEWMLQAADELDDVIGTLRLCFVGLSAEIGLPAAAAFLKVFGSRLRASRPVQIAEPPLL
jgi:hypothetical protein